VHCATIKTLQIYFSKLHLFNTKIFNWGECVVELLVHIRRRSENWQRVTQIVYNVCVVSSDSATSSTLLSTTLTLLFLLHVSKSNQQMKIFLFIQNCLNYILIHPDSLLKQQRLFVVFESCPDIVFSSDERMVESWLKMGDGHMIPHLFSLLLFVVRSFDSV